MRPRTTGTSGQTGSPASTVPEAVTQRPQRDSGFTKDTEPISALRGFPAAWGACTSALACVLCCCLAVTLCDFCDFLRLTFLACIMGMIVVGATYKD